MDLSIPEHDFNSEKVSICSMLLKTSRQSQRPTELFSEPNLPMRHWVSAVLALSGAMNRGIPWHGTVCLVQWSNGVQNFVKMWLRRNRTHALRKSALTEMSSEARHFGVAARVIPRVVVTFTQADHSCMPKGHAPVVIYITRHITWSRYVWQNKPPCAMVYRGRPLLHVLSYQIAKKKQKKQKKKKKKKTMPHWAEKLDRVGVSAAGWAADCRVFVL